jgi:hypothetical protein
LVVFWTSRFIAAIALGLQCVAVRAMALSIRVYFVCANIQSRSKSNPSASALLCLLYNSHAAACFINYILPPAAPPDLSLLLREGLNGVDFRFSLQASHLHV